MKLSIGEQIAIDEAPGIIRDRDIGKRGGGGGGGGGRSVIDFFFFDLIIDIFFFDSNYFDSILKTCNNRIFSLVPDNIFVARFLTFLQCKDNESFFQSVDWAMRSYHGRVRYKY